MGHNPCAYCCHDHTVVAGYPGGCPFAGTAKAWDPGRPKAPSVEDVIGLADRQRERAREVWKLERVAQEAAEWEQLARQRAKLKALLGVVKAEHQAEVAAQNEAALEKVHEIADGQRAA